MRRERDVPQLRLGREQAQRRVDETVEPRVAELEREHARVDARELEEVVDERGEMPHLVA